MAANPRWNPEQKNEYAKLAGKPVQELKDIFHECLMAFQGKSPLPSPYVHDGQMVQKAEVIWHILAVEKNINAMEAGDLRKLLDNLLMGQRP